MTRRRWIADEVNGNMAALVGDHAAHLSKVLRAAIGQEFDISTGTQVRAGTIVSISSDRIEFALGDERDLKSLPKITLVLALAIFKFDRMEWAIEKCTEIGVSHIIPVIARRTDSHLAAAASKRHVRWQSIVRQASEQSRASSLTVIGSPIRLKDLPGVMPADETTRVVLAEELATDESSGLLDVLQSRSKGGEVVLAVGPEGGWAEDEMAWFRGTGWVAASLGPNILRAETAAIVGSALAFQALR